MTNRTITDPYISAVRCVRRLANEYERHGMLYVAFDFDNTVYDYHNQGFVFERVEKILKECKKYRFRLVLFTAKETQSEIDKCVAYCAERGYEPDYVNECPVMNTSKPTTIFFWTTEPDFNRLFIYWRKSLTSLNAETYER